MQGTVRIDLGCNEFAAKRQYRRSAVRGDACRMALIGADEIGADRRGHLQTATVLVIYEVDLAAKLINPTQAVRHQRAAFLV